MDASTTVGDLRGEVRRFVEERDWGKFHNPRDVAMGICVEAAELLERFQWRSDLESADPAVAGSREVAEELADVVIYCLSFADATGIDVSEAVRSKLVKNAARYPAAEWRGRAR